MPCSTSPSGCSADAELRAVLAQRLDLRPRDRVGDRLVDVERRHVVVLGRDRQVGAAHRPAGQRAARRTPAGWSPRARGAGRCRAGRARPRRGGRRASSQTFSASVLPMSARTRLVRSRCGQLSTCVSACLRRQYQSMDNSSGVGVLDKAAARARARSRPVRPTPRRPRRRRPGSPGRPPTGSPSRWSTTGSSPATCRAASSSARGSASSPPRPARTGCSPPPARADARCATSPARAPSSTAARATSAICVAAAERPVRPARHRAGRRGADDEGRLGGPDPAGLGGARAPAPRAAARAVHRNGRWPAYAAAAGRRASASASRASPRCPRRSAVPAGRVVAAVSVVGPIERLSRHPAASTPRRCWPRPRSSTEALKRP